MAMKKSEKKEFETSLGLLAKSSIIVFISVLLSKIFTYGYRIVIARTYGPETYGLFTLSLMIIGWFIIISKLGLGNGLLRFIPLYRGKNQKSKISYLFKKTLLISIITSITAAILLFFFSDLIAINIFQNPDLSFFLKLFSFVIPITVILSVFLSIIRGYEKITAFSFLSKILETLSKLVILLILIFIGFNSNSIPISYLTGALLTLIIAYFFTKAKIKQVFSKSKKDKKIFKSLFSYSWPLIFFGFAVSVFHWTDSFIIGIFQTARQVGFYNAAVPIALLLTIPTDLFIQLFFPLVTREYAKGNKESVNQLSKQVGKWILMISLPILVLFLVFPGTFINILFGTEYLVAENALRFLAIGAIFTALFDVSKQLITMKGKSRLILWDILIVTIINLILNILLIPKYGINGAGFATMTSMIIFSGILVIQSKRLLSIIPLKRKMINILISVIISTIFLIIIKSFIELNLLTLILSGIFFILIYILLIFLICLDKNDRLILNLIKNKLIKKQAKLHNLETETKDL